MGNLLCPGKKAAKGVPTGDAEPREPVAVVATAGPATPVAPPSGEPVVKPDAPGAPGKADADSVEVFRFDPESEVEPAAADADDAGAVDATDGSAGKAQVTDGGAADMAKKLSLGAANLVTGKLGAAADRATALGEKHAPGATAKAKQAIANAQERAPGAALRASTALANAKARFGSRGTEFYNGLSERLSSEVEKAVTRDDDSRITKIIDAALDSGVLGPSAPAPLLKAARQLGTKILEDAYAAGDAASDALEAKRLKGAMIAAKRLQVEKDGEQYVAVVKRYKELKRIPEGWDVHKMVQQRRGEMLLHLREAGELMPHFQKLMDETFRKVYTRDRRGEQVPTRLEVLNVQEVQNDEDWEGYLTRQEEIRREMASDGVSEASFALETDTMAALEGDSLAALTAVNGPLDAETREVFLFHGTSYFAAQRIAATQFRIDLAGSNAGTLYGRGIYFGENCTKSDEYAKPGGTYNHRTIIVCRVTLGRIYYTDEVDTSPTACEDACMRGPYGAVLGDRRKCRGTFREFIVFDDDQVYPNFIVTYKRVFD